MCNIATNKKMLPITYTFIYVPLFLAFSHLLISKTIYIINYTILPELKLYSISEPQFTKMFIITQFQFEIHPYKLIASM